VVILLYNSIPMNKIRIHLSQIWFNPAYYDSEFDLLEEPAPNIDIGVNLQGKWDTFRTRVNGHFRACSHPGKEVDYHSKGGVSHGTTDYRPVLAG
jgi:hypothetical protein